MAGMILSIITFLPAVAALILLVFLRDDDEAAANRRKRGFGFVDMSSDAEEQKAIDDLQDVEWMGRYIRVNKAEPRQPRR